MSTPEQVLAFASQEAERLGVPADLVRNTVMAESGGEINKVSKKGAIGPMQLMPDTAKGLGVDPNNWQQNVTGGVKYLGQLLDRFGDQRLASAAYNAGPGNVDKYGGVPPFKETQNYVQKVVGMDNKDEDFVPFGKGQVTTAKTNQTEEDFVPFSASQPSQPTAEPQPSKPSANPIKDLQKQAMENKPSQFQQQLTEAFSPLDVLRGKTMTGQTAISAFKGLDRVTLQALAAMGNKPAQDLLAEQSAARAAQPKEPTQSIGSLLSQTGRAIVDQPGTVLGNLGTQMLDPMALFAPGGVEKALAASIPAKVATAAPKLTKAATMTAAAPVVAGAENVVRAGAEGRPVNAENLGTEAGAAALMALPFSVTGGAMTRTAGAPLTPEQQAMSAAVQQGLKVPPSSLSNSGIVKLAESFAGRKALGDIASTANRDIVESQAKQVLGMSPKQELSPESFVDYRNAQGKAYDTLRGETYIVDPTFNNTIKSTIDKLKTNRSDSAAAQAKELNKYVGDLYLTGDELVENIKQLRNDSSANIKAGFADPIKGDLGRTQKFIADQLEGLADRNLSSMDKPDALTAFRNARQNIAKSYTLEDAYNAATNEVSATKLGKKIAGNKIVPEEMKVSGTAAEFAPEYFKPSSRTADTGLTGTEAVGAAASMVSGRPDLAALLTGRSLVRSGLMSGPVQRYLVPEAPLPARNAPAGLRFGLGVPGLLPYVGQQ